MGNLVSLSEMQSYIGLSSADDLLEGIAGRVSAAVRAYCGRPFEATDYIEFYDGEGHDTIFLRRLPLVSLASLSADGAGVLSAEYECYSEEGMIRLVAGSFASGKRNLRVAYRAGEDAVPEDVKQAALDWIKGVYDARGITAASTIQSERTGDYAVTYRDDASSAAAMPGSVREILSLYRVVGHRAI